MCSLYYRGAILSDVKYWAFLCIILRVIEMSDKKTKVDCRLITCGTDKANAKVVGDLQVPDPDPAEGQEVIRNAIGTEEDDGDDD